MPGGDGTGPMGMGAMTGWGRGPCGGTRGMGQRFGGGRRQGRGFGGGFGGGFGWRHRYWATGEPGWFADGLSYDAPSERRWLEQRAAQLDHERDQIRARLEDLESTETD